MALNASIGLISPTTQSREICLKCKFSRDLNLVFSLDESLSLSARKITPSFISILVIHNARNEVRNEEDCGAINPCCSGVACSWSDSRGAAVEESPPDRMPIRHLTFLDSHQGIPARSARAWIRGWGKHHH